jgi:Mg2+ and Co2+ transporter CorA
MFARAARILNEAVMGFLALAALSLGLVPLLFPVTPEAAMVLDAAEWMVVGLFALEFAAQFSVAEDRRRFLADPWRLLDAAILLAALASLLPFVSDSARNMLALRIMRLFRALLFGFRAGRSLQGTTVAPVRTLPVGPPRVAALGESDSTPRPADWAGILAWSATPTREWLHVSNLMPDRLRELARAVGMPPVVVEAGLHESSYPRLDAGPKWTALTLSVPSSDDVQRRDPVMLLVSRDDLLSMALQPLDLQQPPAGDPSIPWGPRCALDIVRRVLVRNEDLAGRLEREVRALEEIPAAESAAGFFEGTFRLKRVLSMARGDLWRLRSLLEMLSDGRRSLPGLPAEGKEAAGRLAEEADFLYETVDNLRESVLSLIDLHINMAAHDTNRFMRLVAIVSTLGLIPAITGGLLGMNLLDSPWPVTLGQVAFATLVLILGVLYAFLAKGWLR